MNEISENARRLSRRQLLGRTSLGLGAVALTSLLSPNVFAGDGKPFA